jgi:two-component system sensor histidine kinase YesM
MQGAYTLLNGQQWRMVIMFAVICGILMFAACVIFSEDLSHRIQQVAFSMKQLENGVLKPLPKPKTKDEIGALIEGYNYLTDELQMLITSQYLAGIRHKNMELKALQAQINPHFLYNTLELINYYAFVNNPEGVEKIVQFLSKFYKISLNHGQDIYQVWQELELTEIYFKIQNIRCENKLSLKIDVPMPIYQRQILKIILQPLVENAIRHGIMNRADKTGDILISGRETESELLLTICDNGVGMNASQVALINEGLVLPCDPYENGSHYGINNINERIKSYYGSAYGLRFESAENIGTTVNIRFPAQ